MVSYRDLAAGFQKLNIPKQAPVIVHASIASIGDVRGGNETVLGALLANFEAIMAPTFTFKTMIIPEEGPDNNGIIYGSGKDLNRLAEFFVASMPSDKLMGSLPETIRLHAQAKRSNHPIFSFSGIGVDEALDSQTLEEPFSPIMVLNENHGWVILIGVDHRVNTAIHVAEQHSGRKTFTRWALTTHGIYECPNYPGCSEGFNKIEDYLNGIKKESRIGNALIQAFPLSDLIQTAASVIREDPLSLLCEKPDCERCQAVRNEVQNKLRLKNN